MKRYFSWTYFGRLPGLTREEYMRLFQSLFMELLPRLVFQGWCFENPMSGSAGLTFVHHHLSLDAQEALLLGHIVVGFS